jgi:hypothetical protein
MDRRSRYQNGIPIEEAPLWMLAILSVLLWLFFFPALVGFLDGAGLFDGNLHAAAAWAFAIVAVLVIGLATRKPWRRPKPGSRVDERPLFVRFSTWLITAVALPNIIHGVLVIGRGGESIDPLGALLLGMILSTIHGFFALLERWKRARAGADRERRERRERDIH